MTKRQSSQGYTLMVSLLPRYIVVVVLAGCKRSIIFPTYGFTRLLVGYKPPSSVAISCWHGWSTAAIWWAHKNCSSLNMWSLYELPSSLSTQSAGSMYLRRCSSWVPIQMYMSIIPPHLVTEPGLGLVTSSEILFRWSYACERKRNNKHFKIYSKLFIALCIFQTYLCGSAEVINDTTTRLLELLDEIRLTCGLQCVLDLMVDATCSLEWFEG